MKTVDNIHGSGVDAETTSETISEETSLKKDSSPVPKKVGDIFLIDPRLVLFSTEPNRLPSSFADEQYEEICTSVGILGKNIKPIEVIRIPGKVTGENGEPKYELVDGERRLRACIENKLQVFAQILDAPVTGIVAVDRLLGNSCRKDLSPLEFGLQVQHILKTEGLSLGRLASMLAMDKSTLSRGVALAKLPGEIMLAIKDPNALRYQDAKTLHDAWKNNPEGVKKAVAEIMVDETLSHGEIMKRLTEAGQTTSKNGGVARDNTPRKLRVEDKEVGLYSMDKKGHANIVVSEFLTSKQHALLQTQIEEFVRKHVLRMPKPKKEPKPACATTQMNEGDTSPDTFIDIDIDLTGEGESK